MNQKQKFIIGVIIITTICLVLLSSAVNVWVTKVRLSENAQDLLSAIIIALIAIVSMIIGSNNKDNE